MKRLMIAALLGGQLATVAQPALAAELDEVRTQQMGVFGGVRVRVPLDGAARQRPIRAGLTVAPALQSRGLQGDTRTRIGEGAELGIAGNEPVRLSIAGTPVSRLARGGDGPDGPRAGVSDLGWVAISVGVIAVTVVALFALCADGEICGSE
ncbi:MAG: hypothetical protein ACXWUX_12285 [Allosphingosinicella sp.]